VLVIVPQFNPIFLSYFLFFTKWWGGGGDVGGENGERKKKKKKSHCLDTINLRHSYTEIIKYI